MIIRKDARRLIFFPNQVGCPIRHRGQVCDDGSPHKSISCAEFLPFKSAIGKIADIHKI
jgi:hypothetical protein